jgi:hypothetical protein
MPIVRQDAINLENLLFGLYRNSGFVKAVFVHGGIAVDTFVV